MITNPVAINAINKITSGNENNPVKTTASDLNQNTLKSDTPIDTIELGKGTENFGTYKVDREKLNAMKLDFQKNTDSFKQMIKEMLEKQGLKYEQVMKAFDKGEDVVVKVDEETRAKAAEAVSANGYWGVEKTSARILDYAKTLSGGDASKLEQLKNAFQAGFDKAKEAFGGKLPDISQQTYDKVMAGFDTLFDKGE
ncbi:MAG: hypothetical protein BGO41_02115 [Clostridiales bacterium 38-18]|nr:MAG: hypothetical protein BGO41_02115 [Clostridiales bacterium 38-18]